MKELKLQNDKYRKDRGGYSRFLKISCAKCNEFLVLYQKDGPGPLKRLYFDRIAQPLSWSKVTNPKNAKELICHNCEKQVAIPYLYKKESRPALLLEYGSITKKTLSLKDAQAILGE